MALCWAGGWGGARLLSAVRPQCVDFLVPATKAGLPAQDPPEALGRSVDSSQPSRRRAGRGSKTSVSWKHSGVLGSKGPGWIGSPRGRDVTPVPGRDPQPGAHSPRPGNRQAVPYAGCPPSRAGTPQGLGLLPPLPRAGSFSPATNSIHLFLKSTFTVPGFPLQEAASLSAHLLKSWSLIK